jgi:very-short-patch-repair endonuclease
MDPAVAAQARERGGVLLKAQVRDELLDRRVAAGELRVTGRRTVVSTTTPPSWQQRLFIVQAEIGEPMAFTGVAALRVYAVPHRPTEPDRVTVLVPSDRDPLDHPDVRIVRTGPGDLVGRRVVDGHPVAAIEVALRHAAAEVSHQKMITLLQDELRLRRTTENRLLSVTGRGREGSAALRRALAVAGDSAQSRQERRLHTRLKGRGVGGYRRGVNVTTSQGFSYWLDFLWETLLAGLEVNGAHHLDPAQAAHDARRARRVLTDLGIVLLPLTTAEIDRDVEGAVDEVVSFLASRARTLGVPLPVRDL